MSGETVHILPRQDGPPDAHGNPSYTWPAHTDATAVPVEDVKVAQRTDLGGEAAIADREAVISQMALFFPPTAELPAAVDRMHVRGDAYDVIGHPAEWIYYRAGRPAGAEVALKRAEG